MAFNLNSLKLDETTVLHLTHPVTGEYLYADEDEKEPVTIELYGRTSKVFRNYIAADNRKKLNPGNARKTKSVDEIQEENADFYTAITKKVSNLEIDGAVVDSAEMIKKMYADPSLSWINDQVAVTLGDVEAFLQK